MTFNKVPFTRVRAGQLPMLASLCCSPPKYHNVVQCVCDRLGEEGICIVLKSVTLKT